MAKKTIITKIEMLDTAIPSILMEAGNTQGTGSTTTSAFKSLLNNLHAEDWKISAQIDRATNKENIDRFNVHIDEEYYKENSSSIDKLLEDGLEELILISQVPIIINNVNTVHGFPSGCVVNVHATYGDVPLLVSRGNMQACIIELITSAFGAIQAQRRLNLAQKFEQVISEFNILIAPEAMSTGLATKEVTDTIKMIPIAKVKEKKMNASKPTQRIKIEILNIVRRECSGWSFTISGSDQYGASFPSCNFMVASSEDTDNPKRMNPILAIASLIPLLFNITDKQHSELHPEEADKFAAAVDWVVSDACPKAFPKNRAGATILNFLSSIQGNGVKKDSLGTMIELIFNNKIQWNPEMQIQRNISGRTDAGHECQFKVSHVLGNFFVEGWLDTIKIRIFKTHASIQVYTAFSGNEYSEDTNPTTFGVLESTKLENFLRNGLAFQDEETK